MFNSMYSKVGVKKTGLDYSRETEDVFLEVGPYAVDPTSGKVLNKTSQPILIANGKVNVKEKIQSYADSVDIYKILEKFALSGCTDTSLINNVTGSFGDFVNIPDNINDFNSLYNKSVKEMKALPKSIQQAVVNDSISTDNLNKLIQEQVAAAMIKAKENNKEVVE